MRNWKNMIQKSQNHNKIKIIMTTQQYYDIKTNYPDAILLFRIADDYMALNQDAEIISKLLNTKIYKSNISVNGNDNSNGNVGDNVNNKDETSTKFKHTDIDAYLPKLIRAGYKVAVCDRI